MCRLDISNVQKYGDQLAAFSSDRLHPKSDFYSISSFSS